MSTPTVSKPLHPKAVLLLAIVGPGLGHLALGQPRRALGFAFFTVLFAALTWKLSPPGTSFVGQHAGGLFVWAMALPDAYRAAKVRDVLWRAGRRRS